MKTAKKLFASLLAVVMVLALAIPAFAVGDDNEGGGETTTKGSITITNPIDGVTYTAYKIFDVTYNTDKTAYAYTISGQSKWFAVIYNSTSGTSKVSGLTIEESTTKDVYVVTAGDDFSAASFAKTLGEAVAADTDGTYIVAATLGPKTAASTETTLTASNLGFGYYFVYNDSTNTSALFSLDTTNPDATIRDKNQLPDIEKDAVDDKGNPITSPTASVGDTVNFQVTIITEAGSNNVGEGKGAKNYVLHDTMSKGLTFDGEESVNVTLNGETVSNADFTVTTPGSETGENEQCTFEVSFEDTFLADLLAGDKLVISYSATINANAVTTDEITNTADLNYGDENNTVSVDTPTEIKTYSFDLIKTGPEENVNDTTTYSVLTGAKFNLYDAETEGNKISLVKVTDDNNVTYYRPAVGNETGVEIEAGEVTIKGLGNGTYYLEETEAPAGYNKLESRQEVKIEDANLTNTKAEDGIYTKGETDTGIQIVNQTGTELPSTGGIGTTIFYVIGGVLIVGAVVLLVTRKRMRED